MELRGIIRAALLLAAAVGWSVGAAFIDGSVGTSGMFTDERDGKIYRTAG